MGRSAKSSPSSASTGLSYYNDDSQGTVKLWDKWFFFCGLFTFVAVDPFRSWWLVLRSLWWWSCCMHLENSIDRFALSYIIFSTFLNVMTINNLIILTTISIIPSFGADTLLTTTNQTFFFLSWWISFRQKVVFIHKTRSLRISEKSRHLSDREALYCTLLKQSGVQSNDQWKDHA